MKLADKILAVSLKQETLDVPEWDAKIGIREMTVEQRLKFGEDAKKWPAVAMARLVIASTFDPATGKPIFEAAHHDAIINMPGAVIDRVVTEICRISGLGADAAEAAEKN